MLDIVPRIFAPYESRNRILYRNLSQHTFTVVENTFLGLVAAGSTSLLEWGGAKFKVLTKISNRYTIPVSTVREWMQKVEKNLQITSRIGRPPALDAEAVANFQSILEMRRTVRSAVPLAGTFTLLGEAVTETKMRLGKRGAAAVSTISVTTQKKLFKECNVIKLKAQTLTDARLKACRCPRLSYIWGCVCMAYSADLLAEHKWNADATTIVVSESGTGSLVCVVKDDKILNRYHALLFLTI